MRNLLPCCIIVAICFSLQSEYLSAQTRGYWWNREFTIGLNLDPPQHTSKPGWNNKALWDSVSSAGFNFSVGLQYKHGLKKDTVHPATRAANAKQMNTMFTVYNAKEITAIPPCLIINRTPHNALPW